MPSWSDTAKKRKMASVSGADHLSALPDALLQHVLSFLPSRDAVQTCVLARRWRDQWKSVPALRITNAESYGNAYYLNKFVNYLLLLRDRSPLHECELKFCHTEDSDEDSDEAFRYVELWIRHAMSSQVRVLRICNDVEYELWQAPNMPLSKHLTRLELHRVELEDCFSDVSSCPALEELKLSLCRFLTSKISSPSLKHLSIILCHFHGNVRTRISAPSLISLELDDHFGLSPLVERMPSLVSAFVMLGLSCHDWCLNGYEVGGCGDDLCEGCCGSHDEAKGCVLLEGLSEAVNLELIAEPRVFTLRKDLKRCPVFSKLKTLLVNEWCMTANFGALLCFLQHSPSIEKLILQFCESPDDMVETGATYDVTEQAFSSKHLTVQVKCAEVDKHVRKMLEVLGTYGIPPEQIEIQPALSPSGYFSFEQRKE